MAAIGMLIRRFWTVIVVIAIGAGVVGYVFRDQLAGAAADLRVGECIDLPEDSGEIKDVQHRPCGEPHDAEVIAALTHPAARDAAYPVVSGFADYVGAQCIPAFEAYIGRDFETDTELDLGYFSPTLAGWGDGDRGFSCHVSRIDGAKLTGSLRAPAASP